MSKTLKEILKSEKCPLRKITKYNIYDVTGELAEYLHKEFVAQKDQRIAELEEQIERHPKYFIAPKEEVRNEYDFVEYLEQPQTNLAVEKLEEVIELMTMNGNDFCEVRKCTSIHAPNVPYAWFNYVTFRDKIDAMIVGLKGVKDE